MNREIKCYKCGKPHQLNYKTVRQNIVCSHCKSVMTFDFPTIRKLKLIRYVIVAVVVGIILFGLSRLENTTSYMMTILTCIIATAFALMSEQLCLYITVFLLNGNYVEYRKEDRKIAAKKKRGK
ncbi:MAG: hypothetical protein ACOX1F_01770 [Erysipelotrichaceae bacterium]|jgi:hypothetical protein